MKPGQKWKTARTLTRPQSIMGSCGTGRSRGRRSPGTDQQGTPYPCLPGGPFQELPKYKDSNEERALDYLRRSAKLGYGKAREVLAARDLEQGARLRQEEETDWAAVCALYQEAVDCGSPEGCWELALLKESGKGTALDKEGADGLIRQAAEKGVGPACTRMGLEEAKAGHKEPPSSGIRKGPRQRITRHVSRPVCVGKREQAVKKTWKKPGTCCAQPWPESWQRPWPLCSRWTWPWEMHSRGQDASRRPWPVTKRPH